MQLYFNFFSIALVLGAAQGLFLALLLVRRKPNRTANHILAGLIFFYSFYITNVAVELADRNYAFPHLIGLAAGTPFLFGPLHYLYTRFMISPSCTFKIKDAVHFIPFLIVKSYMMPFHLSSGNEIIHFIQNMTENGPPPVFAAFSWIMIFQGNIYMLLTLLLLKKYSASIRDSFSSIDKINLVWLRNITVGAGCIWLFVLVLNLLPVVGIGISKGSDKFIALATSIFIYVMGYMSLTQQEILGLDLSLKTVPKYQKSGLTDKQAKKYQDKLLQFMRSEKIYTQSDLTLNELAGRLAIPVHNLSQILNDRLQKNFYDFINYYRIEEAKKRLLDPQHRHLSILGIAYDVGFSSKSVFNAAFKKHTNMTPSQYKESMVE